MFRKLLRRFSPRLPMLVPSRTKQGLAKIVIDSVGHRYRNDVEALKNVNVDIHPGEFVCLLGPSGCGKSTLLYALAGHFAPSGGTICIDGKPVKGPSPERLLMFQEAALFPWLTVKQNLVFALRGRKLPRREVEKQARDFIHLVYLDGFEDMLPHQLSGGMRMRVSLARALAMDPDGAVDGRALRGAGRADAGAHAPAPAVHLDAHAQDGGVRHPQRPRGAGAADRVVVMGGRPGRSSRTWRCGCRGRGTRMTTCWSGSPGRSASR